MRSAIFCLYQKSRKLPRDVEWLMGKLRENVDFLVIAINGLFDDAPRLQPYADFILQRDNKGFDGGAFKDALNLPQVRPIVEKSEELVLCNDTFYGPFVPLEEIFKKFQNSHSDFWGLRFSDNGFSHFIQSFFLVFRKNIIASHILYDFFALYPENSTNFNDALIFYERNIFCYLTEHGYKYDYFYKLQYKFLDTDIIKSRAPILKKKHAFDPSFGGYEKERVMRILAFIKKTYDYDISLIINDIKERYGLDFTNVDFTNVDFTNVDFTNVDFAAANECEQLESFMQKYPSVYIYGLGCWARNIITVIGLERVKAFIISDSKTPEGVYGTKMVYRISQLKDKNAPIVIAANRKNTAEILSALKEFPNVLSFWGGVQQYSVVCKKPSKRRLFAFPAFRRAASFKEAA